MWYLLSYFMNNIAEAIWTLVGKEFPDTEHFRRKWVYQEQRAEIVWALWSQGADLLTDQGKPTFCGLVATF